MIRSVTAATVKAISSSNEFRFSTIGIRSMGRRVSSFLSSRVSDWREKGSVVVVKDQASCDLKGPQHRYLKDAQTQNTSKKYPFTLFLCPAFLACDKILTSDERNEAEASAERSEEEASAERSEEEVQLLYEEWFLEHSKSAAALDENESRFQVFRDILKYIDKHNAAADFREHTHRPRLNKFQIPSNVYSGFLSGL